MKFLRNTLGHKLILLYLLMFIAIFSFVHTYGTDYIEKKVIEDTSKMLLSAGNVIAQRHILQQSYTAETIQNFQSHIEIAAETVGCRILIINSDGDVLIDTKKEKSNDNIYRYHSDFLRDEVTENLTLGDIIKEPVLCVSIPIQNSALFSGYLEMLQPMSTVEARKMYYFNILDGTFYILMAVLALAMILIYFSNVIPLKRLISAARAFSIRRDNPPIKMRNNDEYRDLAAALNIIGEEMSKFDEYQKKFIANISHDFRSPLTSIRGYAAAMKDGTIPAEKQEKYLDIILFETERLSRLTSDLLELNTFDRKSTLLDCSVFNINECIRQTVDTLSAIADQKSISIQLSLYSPEELLVNADHGKIQQVLYNLIDNAIKFSHSNGEILISTKKKGHHIFVSVKDHGIGIPKENMTRIWERFYKSDLSRGKDKKGTGLGLCICQEILLAHSEKINVISTEGVGSEFVFTLKTAPTKS